MRLEVAEEADPAVAGGQQVRGGREGAAGVVAQHAVGVDEGRRAIDEHERHAGVALGLQVGVVAARRHHDQPVDAAREERLRELALARAVLVGAADQRQHAAGTRDGLDAAEHRGVERVRDVLEDEPDARRRGDRRVAGWWPSDRAGSRAARRPRAPSRRGPAARCPSPLTTRDTVARLTPASVATSFIVGRRPCAAKRFLRRDGRLGSWSGGHLARVHDSLRKRNLLTPG